MPATTFIDHIISRQGILESVLPFHAEKDKLLALDLTASNTALTDELLNDTTAFSHYITDSLGATGTRYAIGGYAEHRDMYRFSPVFDPAGKGEEPRRLHLGTDIWGKPNTAVIAPLDGIVHSYAFNNQHGDYGATVILTHHLPEISFYTLYGHLSLSSIRNMHEGQHIEAGEYFGELGISTENGGWPPHLHFQVILDIGGWKGDYPGVCKYSEREKWLANSPDPDSILQLNRFIK